MILNHDVIGLNRQIDFYTNNYPELEATTSSIADEFNYSVRFLRELMPSSDHWPFVRRGVPGAFVSQTLKGEQGGRGIILTPRDTVDKLERRNFNEYAMLLTEFVTQVSKSSFEISQKGPDEVEQEIIDQGINTLTTQYGNIQK